MNDNNLEQKEQVPKNYRIAVIGFLGVMLIFAAVVWIPYFSTRPGPANEDIVAERKAKLADVQAKQQELINGYAWVDKEAKVVRIPIERAMQLSVKRLNEKLPSVLESEPAEAEDNKES